MLSVNVINFDLEDSYICGAYITYEKTDMEPQKEAENCKFIEDFCLLLITTFYKKPLH